MFGDSLHSSTSGEIHGFGTKFREFKKLTFTRTTIAANSISFRTHATIGSGNVLADSNAQLVRFMDIAFIDI